MSTSAGQATGSRTGARAPGRAATVTTPLNPRTAVTTFAAAAAIAILAALPTTPASAETASAPSLTCSQAKREYPKAVRKAKKTRATEVAAAQRIHRRSPHKAVDRRQLAAAKSDAQQAYRATVARAKGAVKAAC